MSLTTDPTDPRLGHGSNDEPGPQNEVYLVLSAEERAKGWVRPFRDVYVHKGIRPTHPTRELTDHEHELYDRFGYLSFETYEGCDRHDHGSGTGRFWTAKTLSSGCGAVTHMGRELSETYARDPSFYGATYCVGCQMHKPVEEFVWSIDGERVGS